MGGDLTLFWRETAKHAITSSDAWILTELNFASQKPDSMLYTAQPESKLYFYSMLSQLLTIEECLTRWN